MAPVCQQSIEDVTKPKYVENSASLSLGTLEVQNQSVDSIIAKWQIDEENPRENQGCFGALNDELPSTYSIQRYSPPELFRGLSTKFLFHRVYGYVHAFRYLQIRKLYFQRDEAGNRSNNYFQSYNQCRRHC